MPSKSPTEETIADFSFDRPIVASVNETMSALKIGREKIYQLLNTGELESYREGGSRKILRRSIEAYVVRRLKENLSAAVALHNAHRGRRAASR